ncbi:hypothetical protein HDU79_006655 [Rhizoclosmatium sp. JEL0117]|nr:hypothetical protein HDU79_006655 [Rhizoclosmatium sp. JEL0117]
MEAVRGVFARYDTDKSGSINASEFKALCYDMGYFLSEEEVQMDLKMLDLDGSGAITYDEFIKWWRRDDRFQILQVSKEEMDRLSAYMALFKKYDSDQSGCIDVREFKNLFIDLTKRKLVNKSLMSAMRDLDQNHDGKVSFNEFVVWSLRNEPPSRMPSTMALASIASEPDKPISRRGTSVKKDAPLSPSRATSASRRGTAAQ